MNGLFIATWEGTAVSDNKRLAPSRGGGQFHNSFEYRQFKRNMVDALHKAALDAGTALRPLFKGPVSVRLEVELPPQMDPHAVEKAAYDVLQMQVGQEPGGGIIQNDKQIRHHELAAVGSASKGRSRIRWFIREATEGDVAKKGGCV